MSVTKVSSPMIESGTKGADIASAATVVIGTDGSYFDITGTTGISTQFTVDAGRRFTLQFDGAVTITDNAAITLSGAANFTTAAGDILSFVATAANTVVQTGYSLVDGGSPVAASSEATYVQFPATQVTSADANRLDDYEEGTWTPVMKVADGTILTHSGQWGVYQKIGRSVFVSASITTTSLNSASGELEVHGIPFNAGTISASQWAGCIGSAGGLAMPSNQSHISITTDSGATRYYPRTWNSAAGSYRTSAAEWSANGNFTFSLQYFAAN